MHDYWNDPPDDQEHPEWYMTLEDVLEQQDPPQSVADAIRKAMASWVEEYNSFHDVEPPTRVWDPIDLWGPEQAECPHGKEWGQCDACDHASDIAYDTAREGGFSR